MNTFLSFRIFIFTSVIFGGCSIVQKGKQTEDLVPLQITLTTSKAYCGGAKPTPEILEKHQQKTIFSFAKIIIHEGDKNLWQSPNPMVFQADSQGVITTRLKEGTYAIVFEYKKDTLIFEKLKLDILNNVQLTGFKEDCLIRYFDQPDAIFEVKKGSVENFEINKVIPCSWNTYPCARYIGNLPPGRK
ncbi:MAG: hypothetical protein JJT77_00260 [Crocinitomicaceae bacterium]|nr:hypothetical protein [Crocinitomicaceae bacterium]